MRTVPLWFAVVAALLCLFVLIRGLFADAASAARQAAPQATLGIEVYDRATDRILVAANQDQAFPAESVVKLLIGYDALARGTGSAARVAQMLSRSDDGIAGALWVAGGGPKIVTRSVALMGLQHTTLPSDPARWGDTAITAGDVVRIYKFLESADQQAVIGALYHAPAVAADGFDQSFGIPAAVGAGQWWVKQGWGCCRPDRVLHTTGLVGTGQRYVVAILSSAPSSANAAGAAAAVTAATRVLTQNLGA
jgi:hypothetical protein